MRKTSYIIVIAVITLFVTASCNKTKTYAQYLEDQERAIEEFIHEKNITVLDEYPSDSSFTTNEFYKDPVTGIYFNVIDKGGRKVAEGEEVYVRFSGLQYFMGTDTTLYSNMQSAYPEILTYGNSSTYTSAAWIVPLKYVGHLASVKMIVPFSYGLQIDKSYYRPAYYDYLVYRIENPN